jgi:hypothetical protein
VSIAGLNGAARSGRCPTPHDTHNGECWQRLGGRRLRSVAAPEQTLEAPVRDELRGPVAELVRRLVPELVAEALNGAAPVAPPKATNGPRRVQYCCWRRDGSKKRTGRRASSSLPPCWLRPI